ncbi:hypothetical protein M2271_002279 [Streptomyces sp. LBL]|uniref:AfsA-related hotdog domain-containing protein n=1 Tax=Streptomyces sp. LBL TaxID=2940562 RepID=UPI002474BF93|nr:AfsA-related hotdog domain-containing protein [Streptomyces sp. LBL]MDH6624477.1 hypothetical protein [Streptomyces sp. LBL]
MSATTRTLLIVGNRFVGFAAQDDVLTVTQFVEEMRLGVYSWDTRPIQVRAGQGVTADDWQLVSEQALLLGLAERLDFHFETPVLAARGEAHKHRSSNILIADLRRDGELFSANLRVHNDNELLLDHQTGEHVQGMVAVEAARQMFLAVSERYHASRHLNRKYYYVIESMNTDFENFLFPVDATIEYRTVRADIDNPDRLSFAADISIHQAGRRASVTHVTYTAFDSPVIEAKEHKRARFAVEHVARTAAVETAVGATAVSAAAEQQPALVGA